jgi:hypothetical protein
MTHARRLALTLALGGVAACQTPATNATPASAKVTVRKIVSASVHVTTRATLNVLSEQGLGLRITDEDAGRVETEYFDVTPFQPEAQNYPQAERSIRMEFQIRPDTLGRGSILLIATVYEPFNVGVEGSRRREHLVPSDHPGATFTKKILAKIEEAALGIERGN